jgi:hypothetical protein
MPVPRSRGVWRDELLLEAVVSTRLREPPTLEDQTGVAPEHNCTHRPQRAEPLETGSFDGARGPPW